MCGVHRSRSSETLRWVWVGGFEILCRLSRLGRDLVSCHGHGNKQVANGGIAGECRRVYYSMFAWAPTSVREASPDGGNSDAKRQGAFCPKSSTRLHRTSKAPYIFPSMPPRLHDCSPSPYVHISSSLHLQRTSRAPGLLTQTPPRRHACSRPLVIPLRGNVYTPAAHFQTCFEAESARLQHASIPPCLHVRRPAACASQLQIS